METRRIGKVSLRSVFIQYLMALWVGCILLVGILVGLFYIGLASGEITPADYAEKQISASRKTITESPVVTADQIPVLCEYAVFSKGGSLLSGSLSQEDAKLAWEVIQEGSKSDSSGRFYVGIERKDEICILRYLIKPQFRSKFLRDHLPDLEVTMGILFIVFFFVEILVLATLFGKGLAEKMKGLREAVMKIRNRDLEYDIQYSGVREIDEIYDSMNLMSEELKCSLKQQWEMEQARKDQISALAHDIKTPLTIIRGNAELLSETPQDDIQKEYNGYILSSTVQIEKYVKELIDLSKVQSGIVLNFTEVETESLLAELEEQLKALSLIKSLNVTAIKENIPKSLVIDRDLLCRAVVNLIANAVEHTPPNGGIRLIAHSTQRSICFTVEDGGCGFAPSELKDAAKQFYMGDKSRSSSNHHGMGLYIAESIAKSHGGSLLLENTPGGGGKVTLKIPIRQVVEERSSN